MHSNCKSMLLAAFAAALIAVPFSANAAQQRQANQVNAKIARTYNADLGINGRANTRAAEDFQDRFTIDY